MSKDAPLSLPATSFEIGNEHDRFWCAAEGRRYAAAIGFDAKAQGEVAICIAELVSNVAKFAGRGTLSFSVIKQPHLGMLIVVEDAGPGIADPAEALQDGYSEGRWLEPGTQRRTGQGLGLGLGAVARMMTHVEMENIPDRGLRIRATKLLAPSTRGGSGQYSPTIPPSSRKP